MEDKWWDLSSYHYDYFGQNNSLTKQKNYSDHSEFGTLQKNIPSYFP